MLYLLRLPLAHHQLPHPHRLLPMASESCRAKSTLPYAPPNPCTKADVSCSKMLCPRVQKWLCDCWERVKVEMSRDIRKDCEILVVIVQKESLSCECACKC